jgi:N-methylhydantoinase B
VSQARGAVPIFIANALGAAVRDGREIHGPDGFRDGDLIISNHAATLGQHLNNVVMYAPIFVGAGKSDLFGFMAVLVHWVDVGGSVIGSMSPSAREIFQEGIQFRSLKLQEQGQMNAGVLKTIESNTRFPQELMGDVEAQIAGCLQGVRLTGSVIGKYGMAATRNAVELMGNRSEQAARAAVSAMPDGEYTAESFLDDDGSDLDSPVLVRVAVRICGDTMEVDFSGTCRQVCGAINSGREGGAMAAARIAFKYLVQPHEPANEGSFRPLRLLVEDGTFISAGGTAAMSHYSLPLPTIVDTVLKALVQAVPGEAAAGHHGNFGVHMFTGRHPRTGELYQHMDSVLGGWGATGQRDGAGPFKTMIHGDTLDVPVDAQEALYPLRIEAYEFAPDSGGAGKFRGGLGLVKHYRMLAPCEALIVLERKRTPPWGVLGGRDGKISRAIIHKREGADVEVRKIAIQLDREDGLTIISGGGGGHGVPGDRSIEHISDDLRQGLVTPEGVALDYGVVIDGEGHTQRQ